MEPPADTNATNGTDGNTNAVETNGIANTNGFDGVSITASSGIALSMNPSLEDFQSDEQRRVLDTVSKVRKCGLDTVLSLPQIVVCGDQSSGKSSVLEALTEIPFPRLDINDNLCTRFATEISLRREPKSSLAVKIIPDDSRPAEEQQKMKNFVESITDLKELPHIMQKAMAVMGIVGGGGGAFAKDTLSIQIQGPDRPQLTLVDIPGLIQSSTKGVSNEDVSTVAQITTHYIKQHRTICLAVVSATNDAANQPILQLVREFDPRGERTLGVITKADLLSAGSGAETSFLELARNEDVFFSLGWHVVKNRKFEEKEFSIDERNRSESIFFKTSSFKALPKENVGIDSLRVKLSQLLFEHVRNELPRLRADLEKTLETTREELKLLGQSRCSVAECRAFLAEINMKSYELCKAGISGHYEHNWFKKHRSFVEGSRIPLQRIRAVIQLANTIFVEDFRNRGHKFHIEFDGTQSLPSSTQPKSITKKKALEWVKKKLRESRGTELIGNYNPNVIAELLWEQSEPWEKISTDHVQNISGFCEKFVAILLDSLVADDVKPRIWHSMILPALKERRQAGFDELKKLLTDSKDFPVNYNHYYTDNVHEERFKRLEEEIAKSAPDTTKGVDKSWMVTVDGNSRFNGEKYVRDTVSNWGKSVTPNMEDFSCEDALSCLLAIYKVQQKTFTANVVTQVIERHIVRGLHDIFSPMVAVNMPDTKVESMLSEPRVTRRQRASLSDLIKKLEEGEEIFRDVLEA
ncbi:hypothetical protein SLS64_008651 [Diaporthe eres]